MRRSLAVLASIGLGIGTIALAAPAQAQTQNAQCTGNSSEAVSMTYPPGIDPGVLVVNLQYQGSFPSSCTTFEWTSADSSDVSVEWSDDGGGTRTSVAAGNQITLDPQSDQKDFGVFATPSAGDIAFTLTFSGGSFTNEFVVTVAAGGGGGGGGDDSESSGGVGSSPASEIQQFGLPASGNCEDGATEAMNWSGIGVDGWGISWAQWANDGAGGPVCTRTVVYDTSTAKWTVN